MSAASGLPGFIVAAPRSGAGKTTVTLGLMRALTRRGIAVEPFKCGPDYIDPGFHAAATGRPSCNLDTWSMRREVIAGLIGSGEGALEWHVRIAIAEGVMGLFDGAAGEGQSGKGATADVAALTGWPVLLVLDVAGQSETAAAIALGCRTFRSDVEIAGVILNRVASARHLALIEPAFGRIGLPVLGSLRRDAVPTLPERHLGLVQAGEHAGLTDWLDRLTTEIETGIRLDDVIACARPASLRRTGPVKALPPPGQRIALARDEAFSFVYPHIIDGWRAAGAQILPFSPLDDEAPDTLVDAVWLPGGYPELHAGRLAANDQFRSGLRAAAERGAAVHGECGGYMVLGAGLEDANGLRHEMLGLLSLETSFAKRRLHLGYRRARLLAPSPLGAAGMHVRGHEFHYASVLACADAPLLELRDAGGASLPERGSHRGRVTGTFFHVVDRED